MAKCEECLYYREVKIAQPSNGMVHSVGICVCDVFQAKADEDMMTAEVYAVGSEIDEEVGCDDWKHYGLAVVA